MWLAAAALAGGCGFGAAVSRPGDGTIIDAAVDAPPDIAANLTCYGPAGAWRVCLDAPASGATVLPPMIDTDKDSRCLKAQPAGWTEAMQPEACFIQGETITVPAPTAVTGGRPLVLVASTQITVNGVLDVASHVISTKPPRTSADCKAFGRAPESVSNGGSGGGAGGSFITRAGNAGEGQDNQGALVTNGVSALEDGVAPAHLRGGCAGQVGGAKNAGEAGRPGGGGGAVYLVAGGAIALNAIINASGAGGAGGNKGSGGSGGGSGGMIVLHSPQITSGAAGGLLANGGGGAGGGTTPANGVDGSDPSLFAPFAPTPGGNNGGMGFPASSNQLDARAGSVAGAGGGGGGGASGYIRSNTATGAITLSPGVDLVP